MENYTTYCTEEQTKKALLLGAPICRITTYEPNLNPRFIQMEVLCTGASCQYVYMKLPTTEQMLNWLEEQGFNFETTKIYTVLEHDKLGTMGIYEGSRKETTLIAIDTALDYLKKLIYKYDL